MGKLSQEQIQEVINMYKDGYSTIKIAIHFGLAQSSIRDLLFRRKIYCRNRGEYQKRPLEQRFWEKVDKNGPIILDTPCWEWMGSLTKGYGYITIGNNKNRYAHRVSWILANGEIPNKLHVLHKCDNPRCVNPDHLWLGTNQDNIKDRMNKGRSRKKKNQ